MTVVVITAPEPVVTLAEAKKHLRVEHTEEDLAIQDLLDAATSWVDGPAGWLGRAVGRQTLELRVHAFSQCGSIPLPYPPVLEVVSVKYVDPDGAEQTLDDAIYSLTADGVGLTYNNSWPSVRGDLEGVRIRYTAGYTIVPAPIRQAIYLLIGHWYENRAAVGTVTDQIQLGVDALLSPFRVWSP